MGINHCIMLDKTKTRVIPFIQSMETIAMLMRTKKTPHLPMAPAINHLTMIKAQRIEVNDDLINKRQGRERKQKRNRETNTRSQSK